jgi:hypothetical protein
MSIKQEKLNHQYSELPIRNELKQSAHEVYRKSKLMLVMKKNHYKITLKEEHTWKQHLATEQTIYLILREKIHLEGLPP